MAPISVLNELLEWVAPEVLKVLSNCRVTWIREEYIDFILEYTAKKRHKNRFTIFKIKLKTTKIIIYLNLSLISKYFLSISWKKLNRKL